MTSLLLKLGQKSLKIAYLFRKVIEGLKWSQNETKLIYQIQFVAERSKPDLYGLLEGMFSRMQFFKKFKIKALLVKTYNKSAQNVLKWTSTRD